MPLEPISSIVPPGGFHFLERSGPTEIRIDGSSFDDVAQKVLSHRLANGYPPGNPLQEVFDYVCGTWPSFCRETDPKPVVPSAAYNGASIATRVASWLPVAFRFSRGSKELPEQEVERRAGICAECPRNRPISGCGSCVDTINRLFFVARRDRSIPHEQALGGCSVIGQHNAFAALTERLPEVEQEAQDKLPGRCWRKTT